MSEPTTTDTFHHPCLTCGSTVEVAGGQPRPHDCHRTVTDGERIAHAYWSGYDRALEAAAEAVRSEALPGEDDGTPWSPGDADTEAYNEGVHAAFDAVRSPLRSDPASGERS